MEITFSILMPTYKSEKIIGETIDSVLNQSFEDFELIITDNNSPDGTQKVVLGYKDKRIKFYKNTKNLGYPGNLQKCLEKAQGKFIYFLGSDDILSPYALEKTYQAFLLDQDIGIVTRPYYWFRGTDIDQAVRAIRPIDENKDQVISIYDGEKEFQKVFESVGQLSGLAMRRNFIESPVNSDIFTAHIYPFLSVFKKHKLVFLKDYILAVRIASSQTRTLSSIYNISPTYTWIKMFQAILKEPRYCKQRAWGIKHICLNYKGLIQIKNYASFQIFAHEVWMLVKYRYRNLLKAKFWFYVVGLTVMPRAILIPLVDWYKNNINSKQLKKIKLFGKTRQKND